MQPVHQEWKGATVHNDGDSTDQEKKKKAILGAYLLNYWVSKYLIKEK